MIKLSGVIFIMAGSIFFVKNQLHTKQQKLHLLLSLIQALHTMESAIRWKGQDVPSCLNELQHSEYCGILFQRILDLLKSDYTLQDSWNQCFSSVDNEIYQILRQMDWSGDEIQLLGNLQYISQSLTQLYQQCQATQRNENKLLFASVGSAAGLLIVILL